MKNAIAVADQNIIDNNQKYKTENADLQAALQKSCSEWKDER